jgi:hypothetical protein
MDWISCIPFHCSHLDLSCVNECISDENFYDHLDYSDHFEHIRDRDHSAIASLGYVVVTRTDQVIRLPNPASATRVSRVDRPPRQNSCLNPIPPQQTTQGTISKDTPCRPYSMLFSIRMRRPHPRAMRAMPDYHSTCVRLLLDLGDLLLKAQAQTAISKDFRTTKSLARGYQADEPTRPERTFPGWWM